MFLVGEIGIDWNILAHWSKREKKRLFVGLTDITWVVELLSSCWYLVLGTFLPILYAFQGLIFASQQGTRGGQGEVAWKYLLYYHDV